MGPRPSPETGSASRPAGDRSGSLPFRRIAPPGHPASPRPRGLPSSPNERPSTRSMRSDPIHGDIDQSLCNHLCHDTDSQRGRRSDPKVHTLSSRDPDTNPGSRGSAGRENRELAFCCRGTSPLRASPRSANLQRWPCPQRTSIVGMSLRRRRKTVSRAMSMAPVDVRSDMAAPRIESATRASSP
jgi:hypothetical protein